MSMAKSGFELAVISMSLSSLYRAVVRVLGYGKVTYYIRQSSHRYWYGALVVELICVLWASSGSLLVVLIVLVVHSNDNIENRLHICSPKGLYTGLQGVRATLRGGLRHLTEWEFKVN